MMDKHFRVEVLSATPIPQQVIYAALHQDYSEEFVYDELHEDKQVWKNHPDKGWEPTERWITEWSSYSEEECGEIAVKCLLSGGRGHFGSLEHPQIVFNCGWFPHSTMQQIRTHRVGISMDVQSMRYTGRRIYEAGKEFKVTGELKKVEEVFYLRPTGEYTDREGGKYEYDEDWRNEDLLFAGNAAVKYFTDVSLGKSEEHARALIPFDVRQHFVLSANVRSLMHLFDLRAKADAQLECQQLCELMFPHFERWVPAIAAWYKENRWKKARLAP